MITIEVSNADARHIAEALRIYRDRFYRHESEVSAETYTKNRTTFDHIDGLRRHIQSIEPVDARPAELKGN